MKYVVLNPDNTVAYTFPEVDELRPTIPVTDLYAPDFLAACVVVEDSADVQPGYNYDPGTGTFSAPPPAPEPTLAEIAEQKAAEATAAAEAAAQAQAEADAAAAALAALAAETPAT